MMSLTLDLSRVHDASGARVVYVEYLGVAPENLPPPIGTKAIRGLGVVLMREAIRLAFELGLDGRVGLHSKPEAEDFYRRLGLLPVGREQTQDGSWLYFESEPATGRRLLKDDDANLG